VSGIHRDLHLGGKEKLSEGEMDFKIDTVEVEIPRGGKKVEDLTGNRFGMLVAVKRVRRGSSHVFWLCKCDCGGSKEVSAQHLLYGDTKSCGCFRSRVSSERFTTHGLRKNPIYNAWCSMLDRCKNQNHSSYHRYGGRGIKVCQEWEDVKVFVNWAEANGYEKGLEIDRIDNDGDYCPENCRFVTRQQNCLNKSVPQSNNGSGYSGVSFAKYCKRFRSVVKYNGLAKHVGYFKTAKEAVIARDQYIIDNDLPHRLQVLTRD